MMLSVTVPTLIDFGLIDNLYWDDMKFPVERETRKNHFVLGEVKGSRPFMAPEIFKYSILSFKADIYALGASILKLFLKDD